MKIAFDAKRANANNTGLGNYSRFVISALARFAPESKYLLYNPRRKANGEYDALFEEFPEIEERLPKSSKLGAIWRTFGIVNDLVAEGVDIFHGLSNEIPVGLKRRGVKSVVTIHDLIFLRVPSNYRMVDRWIYDVKFRYACRHADRVIAVSECTKRDIVELYGTDPAKIEVIYQGCAPHFAEQVSDEAKAEVSERYNLPDRYVVSVGTLEERKNLGLMVAALEYMPSDIHLVACGRATAYSAEVMKWAAERGLTDRIHLLHRTAYHDLPAIYQSAEVSFYPSRYEGFGIPIIEALSGGVPVVAATGSCLEEAGGDAALYVSPDDAKGLAAAAMRFVEDGEFREERVARGREYVKRFSKEVAAEQIDALYRKL